VDDARPAGGDMQRCGIALLPVFLFDQQVQRACSIPKDEVYQLFPSAVESLDYYHCCAYLR
jgi:hypothetical protein